MLSLCGKNALIKGILLVLYIKKVHYFFMATESKLFQVIKKLTLTQKKELVHFFQMSSNKILKRDQEIFEKVYKLVKTRKVQQEDQVWQSILTSEEKKNSKRIKSRLLKGVERYLATQQLETQKSLKSYLLSEYYLDMQLKKNVLNDLNLSLKWLAKPGDQDQNKEIWQFMLLEQENHYRKGIREKVNTLDRMEQHLDNYYAINKMRIIAENISRQIIMSDYTHKEGYDLEIAALKKKSDHPIFQLYLNIYGLITEEDEKIYQSLKMHLKGEGAIYKPGFLKELYGHLMNFCIRQINNRNRYYVKEYHECVKKLRKEHLLLDSGFIAVGRFCNCVNAAISLEEIKWAVDFVDEISPFLEHTNEMDGQQVVNLNRAMIALAKKERDDCFRYCNEFIGSRMYKKDIYLRISADKTLLKALYEEGAFDLLPSKIEQLRYYLESETQLGKGRKLVQLSFLNCLNDLIAGKPIQLEKMKQELLVFDYYWLEKQQ